MQALPGFLVDVGFQRGLERFVGIGCAKETGVAAKKLSPL